MAMFVDKYLSTNQKEKIYFSALYYLVVAIVHGWRGFVHLYSDIYGEFYISAKNYLWVSFEGMKDNHEKLRGKGTFDKTINALQLLKKYYKGRTALRMSINKYNIDEVDDLL